MDNNQNFNQGYNNQMNMGYNNQMNVPQKQTNGFAIAGFVLSLIEGGLISIILCIIGISKSKEKNSGKGLAIAGLIITVVKIIFISIVAVLFILMGAFVNESQNAVVGYYDCKGLMSSNYSMSVEFNKDGTFRYGAYNDLDDNHYSGTYVSEHEIEKDGKVANTKYYNIDLTYDKNDFVRDGVVQPWPSTNPDGTGKIEFGINDSGAKKEGALIFASTYNTYTCTQR